MEGGETDEASGEVSQVQGNRAHTQKGPAAPPERGNRDPSDRRVSGLRRDGLRGRVGAEEPLGHYQSRKDSAPAVGKTGLFVAPVMLAFVRVV